MITFLAPVIPIVRLAHRQILEGIALLGFEDTNSLKPDMSSTPATGWYLSIPIIQAARQN